MSRRMTQSPDTLDSRGQIFLYPTILDEIFGAPPAGAMLLFGGRGIGKSAILRQARLRAEKELESMEPPAGAENIVFIDGRGGDHALRELATAAGRHDVYCLLIDDIDELFLSISRRVDDDAREHDKAHLRHLLIQKGRRDCWVVVTSTTPPSRITALHTSTDLTDTLWSYVLQSHNEKRLDPWAGRWRTRLQPLLDQHLAQIYGNQDERERWIELAIDLSGGHPSLLGAAVRSVASASARPAPDGDGGVLDPDEELLTGVMRSRGLTPLRKALHSLRAHQAQDDGDSWARTGRLAYLSLLKLAQKGGDDPSWPYPPLLERHRVTASQIRERLLATGLMYYDREHKGYRIPGMVLMEDLRLYARQLDIEYDARPAGDGKQQGSLIEIVDGEEFAVGLSGKSWKLLKALFDKKGTFVDIRVLAKEIDKETEDESEGEGEGEGESADSDKELEKVRIARFRGAYQRMYERLKDHGIVVTENRWGGGYRFRFPDE